MLVLRGNAMSMSTLADPNPLFAKNRNAFTGPRNLTLGNTAAGASNPDEEDDDIDDPRAKRQPTALVAKPGMKSLSDLQGPTPSGATLDTVAKPALPSTQSEVQTTADGKIVETPRDLEAAEMRRESAANRRSTEGMQAAFLESQKPLIAEKTEKSEQKRLRMSPADYQAMKAGTTGNPNATATWKSPDERLAAMKDQGAAGAIAARAAVANAKTGQAAAAAGAREAENLSLTAKYGTGGTMPTVTDSSKPRADGPVISDENGTQLAQVGGKTFAGGIPRPLPATPQMAGQYEGIPSPAPAAAPTVKLNPPAVKPAGPGTASVPVQEEEEPKLNTLPRLPRQTKQTAMLA